MKILVAIIIYNRFDNLKQWIKCWNLCHKDNVDFIIIHNYDSHEDKQLYESYCEANNINCISRKNIGMDIGAFQDVCYNRIEGFPEWDYLLWITDDTYPMSKSFILPFINKMTIPNIGVVCMELSNEVKTHIRTTGFMIKKEIAKNLTFPADPILTRNQCFEFEHRSKNAFYEQVKNMKKDVIQVFPKTENSYLWDTHNRAKFNRWKEFHKEFPS